MGNKMPTDNGIVRIIQPDEAAGVMNAAPTGFYANRRNNP